MYHCALMCPYLGFLLREARVAMTDAGKSRACTVGGAELPRRWGAACFRLTATLKYCDTLPQYWEIKGREEKKPVTKNWRKSGGALLGGVIANPINTPCAREIVDDFVARTGTQVMEYVPRSVTVTQGELRGKTTIEAAADSKQARIYTDHRHQDGQPYRIEEPFAVE